MGFPAQIFLKELLRVFDYYGYRYANCLLSRECGLHFIYTLYSVVLSE